MKSRIPWSRQASSKCFLNSEPPSIWMARTGKGNFLSIYSRNRAAAKLEAFR